MSPSLIYFSPIPWLGLHQRPQHCCRILSQHFRVLFVEAHTLHLPSPPTGDERLRHLALPVIPSNARSPALRKVARAAVKVTPLVAALRHRQRALLRGACAKWKMNDPLLLFGHPEFWPLRPLFPDAALAYDHMDDILGFGDAGSDLAADLAALVREADFVNATSGRLAEQLSNLGAKRVLQAGNGVEWEHFAQDPADLPEPAELASLPRPRAIYTGSVAEWFDFNLLYDLARACPEVAFPIVGPLRPALKGISELAPSNVHFLGAKPYAELPAWLAHCQAALIPFLRTPLTEAVDPVKLHEYLAAGLPVLSTPFSNELRSLADRVTLASDGAGFAAGLKAALNDPPKREAQAELARAQAWDRRLAPFIDALSELASPS